MRLSILTTQQQKGLRKMGGRGASLKSLIRKYEDGLKRMYNPKPSITRAERRKLIKAGYFKSNKR